MDIPQLTALLLRVPTVIGLGIADPAATDTDNLQELEKLGLVRRAAGGWIRTDAGNDFSFSDRSPRSFREIARLEPEA